LASSLWEVYPSISCYRLGSLLRGRGAGASHRSCRCSSSARPSHSRFCALARLQPVAAHGDLPRPARRDLSPDRLRRPRYCQSPRRLIRPGKSIEQQKQPRPDYEDDEPHPGAEPWPKRKPQCRGNAERYRCGRQRADVRAADQLGSDNAQGPTTGYGCYHCCRARRPGRNARSVAPPSSSERLLTAQPEK
jgi:hypothetical protein